MIQYGTIYRDNNGWASMDDVTDPSLESIIRTAIWQRRSNMDVLSIFEINLATGSIETVFDRDAILAMEAAVPESDWHYFHSSRSSLPIPVVLPKKITTNVLKLSPETLADAAE